MGDSAELLFKIGADASDAEGNLARFRSLMGKDLAGLEAEVSGWAKNVFGSFSTVGGAMLGTAAAAAAAVVAIGAAAEHANEKYLAFVGEIGHGSKVMQLGAEDASKLHFAASKTGVEFETLAKGVALFESKVVKANASSTEQVKLAAQLGVSTATVAAGERNIMPLLEATMDRFRGLASGTERAALARDLFARGGTEMLGFLKLGADGFRKMGEEAERMGLILTSKDLAAVKEYKLAARELKEQQEALDVAVGRSTITLYQFWAYSKIGLLDGAKEWAKSGGNIQAAIAAWAKGAADAKIRIEDMMKSLRAVGDQTGELPKDGAATALKDWYGLSSILETVKGKLAGATSEEAKNAEEISHLRFEIEKATDEYRKLIAASEMAGESAQREAAAIAALPAAVKALTSALAAKLTGAQRDAMERLNGELLALLDDQGVQEEGLRERQWDDKIQKLRVRAEKEVGFNTDVSDRITEIWIAGRVKITQEEAAESNRAQADLEARIEGQGAKSFALQKRQWEQEIEGLRASYAAKNDLGVEREKQLAALATAGRARIQREETEALEQELRGMQGHLAQLVMAQMTTGERLRLQYELDVDALRLATTEKLSLFGKGSAAQLALLMQSGLIQASLAKKLQLDLNTLVNSQGWQGVFGARFATLLGQNEAAAKRWASGVKASLYSVQLDMVALDAMGRRAFDSLAQGMGAGIAHAFIYEESIGKAMRAALAATLESIAAECAVQAIYATAIGFLRLAQHDYPAAASAFTAAGVFGGVGAVAAVAGRAIAPKDRAGAAGSGAGAFTAASGGAPADSVQQQGPQTQITVYVQGHVHTTDSLIDAINDAVTQRDKKLNASHTMLGEFIEGGSISSRRSVVTR